MVMSLFFHRSGNEFHTNDADGPGCNDRQQRVVKHSRSSSPATTKPNKPPCLKWFFRFFVSPDRAEVAADRYKDLAMPSSAIAATRDNASCTRARAGKVVQVAGSV